MPAHTKDQQCNRMQSNDISKYQKFTTAQLKGKAIRKFNAWIRKRDKEQACINCSQLRTLQAGHFFSAYQHENMRFNEDNVNGECLPCNYYNSQSHAHGYAINLQKKIGKERFDKLTLLSKIRTSVKNDRFLFIDIIEKYK
jgi:hypothetical protein